MDEKLITEYYNSLKPLFGKTAYHKNKDNTPNPIYWDVNLKSFLTSVDKHLEDSELLIDYEPIKKDFYRIFENVTNEIFEVFERVYKYVEENKERSAINSISIHLIDLKKHLYHLKSISISLKYIALNDLKIAFKVKELFVYNIERFIVWLNHETIDIMKSPLRVYIYDIYEAYTNFNLSKILIEPELSKIKNLETEISQDNSNKKLKWNGSKIELVELVKALIENNSIKGTQKEIFNQFSEFFDIELKYPDKTIQDIKIRNNGSETIFLDGLKTTLFDYLTRENIR